jgi:signal transduction histidine kinase
MMIEATVQGFGSGTQAITVAFVFLFALSTGVGLWLRKNDVDQITSAQNARQTERNAIARELHDVVAHHMTGIVLQAQAAKLVLPDDTATAVECLDQIEASVRRGLDSIRSVVGSLRTVEHVPYAPVATIDDIRALAGNDGVGPEVTVHISPEVERLPDALIAAIHRIGLEAVSNAKRHASGASGVDVRVEVDETDPTSPEAVVSVVNDGAFVVRRGSGFGLTGIDERVNELGGSFTAGPRPGGGWALEARLAAPRLAARR